MPITGELTAWVVHFMLFVIRMSALFILSPVFGRTAIPNMLKVTLSVMVAFIAINFYPPPQELPPSIAHFILAVGGELLVGLVIGYVTTMFFSIVFTAGQTIDTQIGFGMVQIYDVQSNAQIPVAGSLLNLVLLLSFLLANGHLVLISLLFDTFEYIPVGNVQFRPELGWLMLKGFVQTFILSLNVALPIIASGLVMEVGLGIVVRTSPQMNIFAIGLPMKVLLGLVMLSVVVPVFAVFTKAIFEQMYLFLDEVFLRLMPEGGG
jgi:flagellar biosynthetic protein FliR